MDLTDQLKPFDSKAIRGSGGGLPHQIMFDANIYSKAGAGAGSGIP
jgi:hypothetical protein